MQLRGVLNNGTVKLASSLHELKADVFAGTLSPSAITFVRSLTTLGSTPQNIDTAVFTGPRADYTVAVAGGVVTVTDNVGTDGVDTLRNVERLQFADVTINSGAGTQGTAVPNVLNQLQATATTNLANVGLGVSITTANSATIAVGRVISQSSAGGSQVTAGSVIGLVISLGPTTVLVPNVVGTTQAGATSALAGVGLLTTTTSASSDTVAAGNVISQVPAAGQSAIVGSAVGLVISNGPSTLGLVAAFGFEETVGTAIIDSSANPMNGTINNANGTGTAPTRVANGGKIRQGPAVRWR